MELESIEKVSSKIENSDSAIEISEAKISYLKELNVSSDKWVNMDALQQDLILSRVNDRLEELGFHDNDVINEAITRALSPELVESFNKNLEFAPNDIEYVSDAICDISEFQIENWVNLSLEERISTLNKLELRISEIEHRPHCPVYIENMGPISIENGQLFGRLGGYSPDTKDITLNSEMLYSNNPIALKELLDTIIHEGRHAYQDYNVNECEVHPRHAEVISWSETMEGGKWGYCGGSSSLLGQRLYEQQSIEIDARNFAADVLDKYEQKLYA